MPIRGTNNVKEEAFHPMPGYGCDERRGGSPESLTAGSRYSGYLQGITSENKFGGTIGKLAELQGDAADDSLNKSGPQVNLLL